MQSWSSTSVGVADLDDVLKLWHGAFGLDIIGQQQGADEELAGLWGLEASDISRQALLATPGKKTGMIHLVEFEHAGPAFRENVHKFDQCPKNLDVYVTDMPTRIEVLKSAGYTFQREPYNEMTAPDGTVFREIHMVGHDAINIVLIEIIGMPVPLTAKGFSAIGPVVTVVADVKTERDFYRDVLGLELLNDNLLEGPVVERMLELPPGGAMEISIWGTPDNPLGRLQLANYRGVNGNNIFPQAVPKQRGILQVSYEVKNLEETNKRLDDAGITWSNAGVRSTLLGEGPFIRFKTPAGFQINAFQPGS